VDSAHCGAAQRRYSQFKHQRGFPPIKLAREDAIEVMTGAICRGSDCVIPVEQLELAGGLCCSHHRVSSPYHNVPARQ